MPEYMVPGVWVVVEELPLTANGKVDRRGLPEPEGMRPELESGYEEPGTETEKKLAEIWGEVLGLERVGVHDNFFDLGGHSLLATQVVSRIREGLRVELPLRKLFEQATVAELAEEIERSRGEEVEVGRGRQVTRIGKRKRGEGKLELSYAQQRLWFLNQLQPENAYYNCPLAVWLGKGVDVGAVEKSLVEIVRRHEVLRTRIVSVDGKPEQVIEEEVKLGLVVEEVSGREEAEKICGEEAERPFDLSAGPLRVRLLRVAGEQGYVLMVTMHHIVSDGWSLGILLRELRELYEGYASGKPAKLEELGIQYGDFAEWQREWLQGEVLEEQLGYWREQLRGMEMLQLPTDRVRPAEQSYRGGERVVVLSKELSEGIRKLSQKEGGTLFMVALAGFQALLGRYTGQKEISVGTAIANRNREETEGLIGFFVNTLVMRTDVSGEPSFEELVRRVKGVALGAYGHQDLPFEKLVEEIQPERSMSRNPLVQVMLTVQNAPWKGVQLPAGMTILGGEVPTTRFDLEVHLWEMGEQVVVRFIYSRDLFDEETVERMMRHYERVLDGGVRNPEEKVWRLPLMSAGERLEVLARSCGEAKEYGDKERCVHELVAREASRHAERMAVVCEGEGISYGELNRRANQLGRYLRKRGVGPEVLVGIAMERSVEMVVGVLGILKAGGAYVPLDVEYPKERLRYMLEDSGVQVLVSESAVLQKLPETLAGVEVVRMDEEEERKKIGEESGEDFESGVRGENLAYMIYTSGSTGKPKGAMNEHRGLTNRLLWMQERFGLGEGDVVLQKTPISFDVSVWELLWAVMVGARLVMARPGGHREGGYLGEVIEREKVTTLHFVPSMLQAFLQEEGLEEKCKSVKRVISSGEALSGELVGRFYERMGRGADGGAKLYNLYGPTEAAIDVTCWECERGVSGGVVPIGRAIANTEMYVLDEKQEVVPEGVSGELYIGGVQVGRGYWKREELTRERFISNPYGAGRLYRTGDVGRYVGDGGIEYQGRRDEQVKLRGYRIELGEIEAVLQEHEGVRGAAVVVREVGGGGEAGTAEKRLVGYVVLEGDEKTSELRRYLKERLPEYMVPGVWVEMKEMPLTANGKLDRKKLPEPGGERPELEEGYEEPGTETEKKLAEIWAQVLGVEKVGVHDNFFDLGGDSILSLQIVSRAKQGGMGVSVRQLFQSQTVGELAAEVERWGEGSRRGESEAEQGEVRGEVELTPIQRWYLEQELAEVHHWNQAVLMETGAEMEVGRMREGLAGVVKQHDALRMRYERRGGEWRQFNGEWGEKSWGFAERDLSEVKEEELRARVEEVVEEEQKRLDLEKGPVFRAVVLRMGEGRRGRLLLVAHHLVMDGVSWRIVLGDLGRAYEQLGRTGRVELGRKTSSYQQWGKRLQEYGRSEEIRGEAEYWMGMGVERAGRLPVDFVGGENEEEWVEVVTRSMSEEETEKLLQEVPEVYHTQINDVLLTALGEVMGGWTGRDEVLVDVEGHGREEIGGGVDVTGTVGWFTTIYPVLLEGAGGSSKGSRDVGVGERLKAVKEQLRRVPGRGLGYGLLRYGAGNEEIAKALREKRQAEVLFNYLGQFDGKWGGGGVLGAAGEKCGGSRSRKAKRRYVVEIAGGVFGGRLQMNWMYSGKVHARETMERLAEGYAGALRGLIEHCMTPEAGGYTPSDFPLAEASNLEAAELERIADWESKIA